MSKIEQCSRCRHSLHKCGYYESGDEQLCIRYVKPIDNSRMFGRILLPTGRIGRLEYGLTLTLCILLGVIFSVVAVTSTGLEGYLAENQNGVAIMLTNILIFLIPCLLVVFAGIKRTNDSGAPRWFSYVPVIFLFWPNLISLAFFCLTGFYMLKDPSEDGVNEHGSNPAQSYAEQIRIDETA